MFCLVDVLCVQRLAWGGRSERAVRQPVVAAAKRQRALAAALERGGFERRLHRVRLRLIGVRRATG